MSAKATFWAWRQPVKPATAKLVLLCLADCHNGDTGLCNPSIAYLVEHTGLNRKTVIGCLERLSELGALEVIRRNGIGSTYRILTSTEIGTGSDVASEGQTGTENGTGKRGAKRGGLDGEPVPKTVPVPKTGPVPKSDRTGTEIGTGPVPKSVPVTYKEPTRNLTPSSAPSVRTEYLEFAEFMWTRIEPITKQNRKPNLERWADTIRKLVEIDGREPGLVQAVFVWANGDDFWSTNILSADKLRAQFPKLYAKWSQGRGAGCKTRHRSIEDDLADTSWAGGGGGA